MPDGTVFPCTIVAARYGGVYEGARWLAFPLAAAAIPDEVMGNDLTCSAFFEEIEGSDFPLGRGSSPTEAHEDLVAKVGGR